MPARGGPAQLGSADWDVHQRRMRDLGGRRDESALDALYRIKGEARGGRPVGTILTASAFIDMLQPDRIAPSARTLMLDGQVLASRLGSICFIRAPMKAELSESLPDRLFSKTDDWTYWIQNWLPEGCRPASPWIDAMREKDILLPAASSMNVSGEPEIADQEEGRAFCEAKGVPIFLADPENPGRARGSFPILQIDEERIRLLRSGHFDPNLFRTLLAGWDIDISSYQDAKFPLVDIPQGGTIDDPGELRQRLLEHLDG